MQTHQEVRLRSNWRQSRRQTAFNSMSCDLCRFHPQFDRIFSGKDLIQFLANKMQKFRKFHLHNCILIFDAEHVHLKLQVTNVQTMEVTLCWANAVLRPLYRRWPSEPEHITFDWLGCAQARTGLQPELVTGGTV